MKQKYQHIFSLQYENALFEFWSQSHNFPCDPDHSLQAFGVRRPRSRPAGWRTHRLGFFSAPHLNRQSDSVNREPPLCWGHLQVLVFSSLGLTTSVALGSNIPVRGGRVEDSHWMNQALQIALFRRILSLQSNRKPLKDFHLGETILLLQEENKHYLIVVK